MIPVGILTAASGSGFSPAAEDFFTRVTASGCSLTNLEKNAINTLVLSLQAANIWNSLKVIYPMVGACGGACSQNLKSSSFTGSFSAGWTFSSTGATPNGFSAFMETFFNYRTETTGFNQHMSMYSRTQNNTAFNAVNVGAYDSITEVNISQYYTGISRKYGAAYSFPTGYVQSTNSNTLGFQIVSRTAQTMLKLYFNGAIEVTNTNTETTQRPNITAYVGCSHWTGGAAQFAPHQNAFTTMGDGLSDTQASDLYTIVQAFQTTLGRQV